MVTVPQLRHWTGSRIKAIHTLLLFCLLGGLTVAHQIPHPTRAQDTSNVLQFGTGFDLTRDVELADVNGDGHLDIAVANEESFGSAPALFTGGQDVLYLNDGAGHFYSGPVDCRNNASTTAICYEPESASATGSVTSGDLDGDGDIDILTGPTPGNAPYIYFNSPGTSGTQPTFVRQIFGASIVGSSPFTSSVHLALGDLNGDSQLDIVFVGRTSQSIIRNDWLHGNALSGSCPDTRQPPIVTCFGSTTSSNVDVKLGDVDGQHGLDILIAGSPSILYLNAGNGTFYSGTINCAAPPPGVQCFAAGSNADLGDLNGDGLLDVLIDTTVYINTGTGSFSVGTSVSTDTGFTSALGDYDGDGDLDIVYAPASNVVVLANDGTGQFSPLTQFTTSTAGSLSDLALGDLNGDGLPEIVTGRDAGPNEIFVNTTPRWLVDSTGIPNLGGPVVVGDVDGANGPDLVGATGVFLNTGGGTYTPVQSLSLGGAMKLDLVDFDGVHGPDLIFDSDHSRGILWNQGNGQFDLNHPLCLSPVNDCLASVGNYHPSFSKSISVADVDGNGTSDLIFQSGVYLNNGNGQFSALVDAPGADAAGDIDGDGDIDLALNSSTEVRIDFNDGYGHFTETRTIPLTRTLGVPPLLLADVDGANGLDIITPGYGYPGVILLNDGAANFTVSHSTSFAAPWINTPAVVAADIDNDGSRDLVVLSMNFSSNHRLDRPSKVFLNDGAGNFTRSIELQSQFEYLAVGDVDSDGDQDVLLAHRPDVARTGTSLFRNGSASVPRVANNPPQLRVQTPGLVSGATTTPTGIFEGVIPISFTLSDAESDLVGSLRAFYSLDGGGSWQPAVATSATHTADLATSPSGIRYTFFWDTAASHLFGHSDRVVVRFEVRPLAKSPTAGAVGTYQYPGQTPPTYQRSVVATETAPFRSRGTQVRVCVASANPCQPAVAAIVYRLPAGQSEGAKIFPPRSDTTTALRTDNQGFLAGRGALQGADATQPGDRLLAITPVSTTASMSLFFMSADMADPALANPAEALQEVRATGTQTLTVRAEHSLILLNLDVSLEWDARKDPAYLQQLSNDLRRSSEFLFDWTNGQLALGRIRIYQAREHWNDAHIRIYATNRMRPNAVKGGIVPVGVERPDPTNTTLGYTAGQLRMGATWNRYGDAGANLGEDWSRTLAHELGHYALFLEDNYLGLQDGALVGVSDCRSAMTDPYRDDYSEFAPRDDAWVRACQHTLSEQLTGRSDWETIAAFYNSVVPGFQLHEPSTFDANPGPASLPIDFTEIVPIEPAPPSRTLTAPIFLLTDAADHRYLPGAGTRAFLFQNDRLIDLGQPTVDQVLARGAQVAADGQAPDRLCVYDVRNEHVGCRTIATGDPRMVMAAKPGWLPEIRLTPVTSTTLTMTVTGVVTGLPLAARLYPSTNDASIPITLVAAGDHYTGTFVSPIDAPVFEGYVHIWVNEPEAGPGQTRREAITDFKLGGNPGRIWASRAPRGNPGRIWASRAPVLSSDGQALIYGDQLTGTLGDQQFFALQATQYLPTLPLWATAVGPGYRLSVSPDVNPSGMSINIGYSGDDIASGEENGIWIYFYNETLARWERLTDTRLDTLRNEAAAGIRGPGLYALMSSIAVPLHGPGWNLFAYAAANQPLPNALASISGAYTTVYGYDGQNSAEPWKIYDTTVPQDWAPLVNDLTGLVYGQGYWIHATEAITVLLKGGATPAVSAVRIADTLSLPPATYYGIISGVEATSGLEIDAFIAGQRCGQTQTQPYLVNGRRQAAFAIAVSATTAGMECGLIGRPITFVVRQHGQILGQTTGVWNNDRAQLIVISALPVQLYLPFLHR